MSDKLVLHPRQADAIIKPGDLQSMLAKAGLLGAAANYRGEAIYLPGEHFLSLLTFMGCAPTVNFSPPEDGGFDPNFCYIGLPPPAARAQFIGNRQIARAPRCRACRKPIQNWGGLLDQWQEAENSVFACPHCAAEQRLENLDWRQRAGFARVWVDIFGIFEAGAVPTPGLLDTLQALGIGPWNYFYSTSPAC